MDGVDAEPIRERMLADEDHAAPESIYAEVLSLIRRDHLRGVLDSTAAALAVEDLMEWPGSSFGHRMLLGGAWELRATLRIFDGLYVALAEALGAPLLTLDTRLARAPGIECAVEVPTGSSHN